jgi:hypothetical protein
MPTPIDAWRFSSRWTEWSIDSSGSAPAAAQTQ